MCNEEEPFIWSTDARAHTHNFHTTHTPILHPDRLSDESEQCVPPLNVLI